MADDPIVLVPPDPRWPALFAAERDAIAAALAPWLTGAPEHIGSTAVHDREAYTDAKAPFVAAVLAGTVR